MLSSARLGQAQHFRDFVAGAACSAFACAFCVARAACGTCLKRLDVVERAATHTHTHAHTHTRTHTHPPPHTHTHTHTHTHSLTHCFCVAAAVFMSLLQTAGEKRSSAATARHVSHQEKVASQRERMTQRAGSFTLTSSID